MMCDQLLLGLRSADATQLLGSKFVDTLYSDNTIILLSGELGAGKTTFVQGLAAGLGIAGPVTSPTFALEQRYKTNRDTHFTHIDLYRLDEQGAEALVEQICAETKGILCIEWPERLQKLPESAIRVHCYDEVPPHLVESAKLLPVDGRLVHVEFEDVPLPSSKQIEQWRQEVLLPQHVVDHCEAVATLAKKLADWLIERGVPVRSQALCKAAQLHDLLRFIDFKPGQSIPGAVSPTRKQQQLWDEIRDTHEGLHHERAAEAFVAEKGYPEIGSIIRLHGLSFPKKEPFTTIEQKVLFYADKRVRFTDVVSIEERYEDLKQRYGNGEESPRWQAWLTQSKNIEQDLFGGAPPF